MIELLVEGNVYFTLPLTALAVSLVVVSGWKAYVLFMHPGRSDDRLANGLDLILHLGIFSFIFGLLGHAVSLYQMLTAIEVAGDISPALVFGGLRVSFIVPIYGLLILTVAAVLWFLLRLRYRHLARQ